jgi:hypothetical protein
MKYTVPKKIGIDHIDEESRNVSQKEVEEIAEINDFCIFPVNGDYLAGVGICDGDYVGVCLTRMPRPPKYKEKDGFDRSDTCLCYTRYPTQRRSAVIVMQYDGIAESAQMVVTRYKHEEGKPARMNDRYPAVMVYGVAFACWNAAGMLKWEHDISECPSKSSAVSAAGADNINDTMPVADIAPGDILEYNSNPNGTQYHTLKECMLHGLDEIRERKQAIAAVYLAKKHGEMYRGFKTGEIQAKGIEGDFLVEDIVHILCEQYEFSDKLSFLVPQVFETLKKRWNSEIMTIMSIYALGRMAGTHAERELRKGRSAV